MAVSNPLAPIAVTLVDASGVVVTPLVAANNLSDVASIPVSRLTLLNYTTTATAAGTTTLTVASTYNQYFTGSTTQTVTLPVATTMTVGMAFRIVNNSTGLVTVNSSGANAVWMVGPSTAVIITCILASGTSAASWDVKGMQLEVFIVAASDETTALTTGTAKVTWPAPPYPFYVTGVFASLTTAQASGTIFTVDINEAGTTIISTKLTIDNTETSSSTAATPPVISDGTLAAYAQMSVDIDQIGDGTAKGLKVGIVGHQ